MESTKRRKNRKSQRIRKITIHRRIPVVYSRKRFPLGYFVLFVFGLFLICAGDGYLRYKKRILSFKTDVSASVASRSILSNPTRLYIPSLTLSLPVEESSITDGVWHISENGISHLTKSARPGQNGNIIMYGHNKNSILGTLPKISVGDIIQVISRDQTLHTYRVRETDTVSPDNLLYVNNTDIEVLTLYTCTGFFDSMRFVVRAIPVMN